MRKWIWCIGRHQLEMLSYLGKLCKEFDVYWMLNYRGILGFSISLYGDESEVLSVLYHLPGYRNYIQWMNILSGKQF